MEDLTQQSRPQSSSAPAGHRDACDECHRRKIRCIADHGACQYCIHWGNSCTYSPRVPLGRPRKRKSTNDAKQHKNGSSASGSNGSEGSKSNLPTKPRTTSTSNSSDIQSTFNNDAQMLNFDDAVSSMEQEFSKSSSSSSLGLLYTMDLYVKVYFVLYFRDN
jgi:hypothetical protein